MEMESSNLILFVYKWRKPLIIISLTTAVLAAIFSGPWFITPKFKSSVVMFPATTNSVAQAILIEKSANTKDVLEFGKEEEAEQMLQILNSDEIRDRVIEKYNLMEHYKIDQNSPYKRTNLYKKYESNISFRRTEYMSVVVEVLDTDPQMAADMANEIASLVDSVKNRIQQERASKSLQIVERQFREMEKRVFGMEDSLKALRRLGIHDYEVQVAVLNEQYSQALIGNKPALAKEIEAKLQLMAEYGGAYTSVRDQLKFMYEDFNDLKMRYEEARVDAESDLPHKFIVNNAFKAEKKSYPIRWLIVVVSTFGAFVLSLLTIITLSTLRQVPKE